MAQKQRGSNDQATVGQGCTVCIGSDCYAAHVVSATRCTVGVRWDRWHAGANNDEADMAFRWSAKRQRYVRGYYVLDLTRHETVLDPSF